MSYLQVAIGIIVRSGHILVTRRPEGGTFAGRWEFPGGKLLPDESATECLHRELAEELGVEVTIVGRLAPLSHDYGHLQVTLHPFVATLDRGQPAARASKELRWVSVQECVELDFPEANASLLRQLQPVLRSLGLV